MASASNRRLAVEEFVKRLRQGLSSNMLDVRLFGSEARGEATSESDIDVLVVGNCYLIKDEQNPALKKNYADTFDLD